MPVTVLAHLIAQDGKEDDLEQALRDLVAATHGESGCLQYVLHRDVADPRGFATFERWTDAQALEGHFQQPHLQEVLKRAPDLLAAEPDIRTFEVLEAGDPAKGAL